MSQDRAASESRVDRAGAFGVVLVYAVCASLWILLSDKAVEFIFSDPQAILLASMIKGWLFVLVTSFLLFYLLRRVTRFRPAPANAPESKSMRGPWLILAMIITALVGAGILNVISHEGATETARLQAIADLKAKQIADWLAERRGDGDFIASSAYYGRLYEQWHAGDTTSAQTLLQRLELYATLRLRGSASLLDPHGAVLLAGTLAPGDIPAEEKALARTVSKSRGIQLFGPYRDSHGLARLDMLVPLAVSTGQVPLAVLHIDLSAWLYPTLKAWPAPSESGETLLVRRDGAHALFLNDLRHRSGAALSLRLPLAQDRLLAAQVLNSGVDHQAVLHGEDYRGQAVIGVAREIAGTDWHLIAKMDRNELYAQALHESIWLAFGGLLALFMSASGLSLLRQREQLAVARATQAAQAQSLDALKLLGTIADCSDDAILAKDLEGRYLLFNRAAEFHTGKLAGEVLGKDDIYLFPRAEAEYLRDLGRRVVDNDRVITEAMELSTPRGPRVFLATHGPLHDEQGKVIGLYGISRDITEQRAAEERIAEETRRFRFLLDSSRDGIVIVNHEHRVIQANRRFAEMLGHDPRDLPGMHTWDFDADHDEAGIRDGFSPLQDRVFETRHRRKDGSVFDVEVSGTHALWDGEDLVLCICRDISERKQAEKSLRDAEARWIMAIDSAGHGVWDWNPNDDRVYFSPGWKAMLGYADSEIGNDLREWSERVHPEDLGRCLRELERHFRGETETYICEHRLRRKDGAYIWILDQGRVVARDADGKPTRVIGTHTDIDLTKAAETHLLEQSHELEVRNEELQRFNQLMIGRELDMIELKRRVNALAKRLGEAEPYDLGFADEATESAP